MFKERIKTHHSAMSSGKKYLTGMESVAYALIENNKSIENNSTIYIHVPFCNKICSFCNMRRSLQSPDEKYSELVIREIEEYSRLPYINTSVFDAVYFGGGTPTMLDSDSLCNIIDALKQSLLFNEDAEFTVETTVTELTEEKMERLIEAGVNRFSVGIQTFNNEGRKKMGRIGSGEYAYERLRKLKSYPDIIVSMDLIYNYPEQTIKDLYNDLDKILELGLDGFSMYSLIDMNTTTIDKAQGEKNDEKMFFAIAEYMEDKGYSFLELTKMVKSDRYKYILNRHKGADTLPLGAGAGGSINNISLMNPIKIDEYESSIDNFDKRQGMLFKPQYKDIVRFKGDIQTIHLPRSEKLYKDIAQYNEFLNRLLQNNLVVKKDGEYILTKMGIFWGNTISRHLSEMI